MPCPTCHDHDCAACVAEPPSHASDPLVESCDNCDNCRRPHAGPLPARPVRHGDISATAAALHSQGVSLAERARILYGEDTHRNRLKAASASYHGRWGR